jgi:hypothetical protein
MKEATDEFHQGNADSSYNRKTLDQLKKDLEDLHCARISMRSAGSMISPQSFSSLLSLINLTQLPPTKIAPGQLFQHLAEDRLRD